MIMGERVVSGSVRCILHSNSLGCRPQNVIRLPGDDDRYSHSKRARVSSPIISIGDGHQTNIRVSIYIYNTNCKDFHH